ncbi:hypothetical protein V6N13_085608 [Hibiscus sabdariffa]
MSLFSFFEDHPKTLFAGMRNFIVEFEYLAEDLCLYFLEAFDIVVEDLIVYFQVIVANFGFEIESFIRVRNLELCPSLVLPYILITLNVDKLRGNRAIYEYSGGDHEIENMAALCLERTPSFHKWFLEKIEHMRDEFRNVTMKGLRISFSVAMSGKLRAQLEAADSTKAPLLRKPSKQEKKNKDHVIAAKDIELEEHRKSTDRGVNID